MTDELRVLGAGSALPRVGYGPSGYALVVAGEVTLLDCGPGSVRSLAAAGIELEQVHRVVLSHYHLDHCLDLFALFFARRNPALSSVPTLEVFGPPGLRRWVERSAEGLGRASIDRDARLHELELDGEGGASFAAGPLAFRCASNGHTDVSVSWRVERRDAWSLVYTGDTNEDPAVARLARGVDLFVAECSFPEEEAVANHLTPRSAARLASQAGVGRLLLTHFYPSLDPARARREAQQVFPGPVDTARDGSVHPLER